MSWSFSAIGRPSAVIGKAQRDILGGTYKCPEPEETAKRQCVNVIETLLAPFPVDSAVQITANGSQHAPDHKKPDEVVNSFMLDIKPIYGFVE